MLESSARRFGWKAGRGARCSCSLTYTEGMEREEMGERRGTTDERVEGRGEEG